MNGQYLVGILSAALVGACLGFLRYNFNPASIFMGDAGSLFLGFVLAATAISSASPTDSRLSPGWCQSSSWACPCSTRRS